MADRKKKASPGGITSDPKAQAAMTAEVNRSIDEWRASQGLPAIDRSKRKGTDGNL